VSIDEQLTVIGNRLGQIQSCLDSMAQRQERLERSMLSTDVALDRLEHDIDAVDEMLGRRLLHLERMRSTQLDL